MGIGRIGDVIHKRYELVAVLGKGSMGIVYKALDYHTDEYVALKCVLSQPTSDPYSTLDYRKTVSKNAPQKNALANEFNTLMQLRHPNIIRVLDHGLANADQPFFTMEYVSKRRDLTEAAEGLPLMARVDLLVQVLRALMYMHPRMVVHRDLKPSNILVTQDNVVKVADFGIALSKDRSASSNGNITGTIAYMDPAVLNGAKATMASDLYAFGLIATVILGGQYPYPLSPISTLMMHISYKDPNLSRVPSPYHGIIERLMCKEPEERYRDAESVLGDLLRASQVNPV